MDKNKNLNEYFKQAFIADLYKDAGWVIEGSWLIYDVPLGVTTVLIGTSGAGLAISANLASVASPKAVMIRWPAGAKPFAARIINLIPQARYQDATITGCAARVGTGAIVNNLNSYTYDGVSTWTAGPNVFDLIMGLGSYPGAIFSSATFYTKGTLAGLGSYRIIM